MESAQCSAESIHEGLDMNVQLTRARFEKSAQNHLLRAKQNILDGLRDAKITQDQVNMVCLRRFQLSGNPVVPERDRSEIIYE